MRSILLVCALAMAACAKQELTTDSTTAAQRSAESAGAEQVPKAALALQLSRENLQRAQELYEDGDKDEAKSMLMRAEADAELAALLARAEDEKTMANAAMEEVLKVKSSY